MLAWVNLHARSPFWWVFAPLGIYFGEQSGAGLERAKRRRESGRAVPGRKRLRSPESFVLCSRWRILTDDQLHVHIYSYLSDRFLMDHIDEISLAEFSRLGAKCFAVLVLLAVLGTAGRGRRSR